MGEPTEVWFYFSFADPTLPKGTQFLGGCYVKVNDEHREEDELATLLHPRRARELDDDDMLIVRALRETYRLGINPGGEVQSLGPIAKGDLDAAVPFEDRERLLTKEEVLGAHRFGIIEESQW